MITDRFFFLFRVASATEDSGRVLDEWISMRSNFLCVFFWSRVSHRSSQICGVQVFRQDSRYFIDNQMRTRIPKNCIVSSVNIFQKAIYRKSLKWERFHCEIMSLREFERKLPRKTNCKCPLQGIFMHQKRLVIFLVRNCSLRFKLYEGNQKKQLISRSVRTQFSGWRPS